MVNLTISQSGDHISKQLAELRSICKENGLPVTGNKSDIIQRIEEFYQKDEDDLLGESLNEDDLLNDDSNINEDDVLGSLELEGKDETPNLAKPIIKRPIQPKTDIDEEEPPSKRCITMDDQENSQSTLEKEAKESSGQPEKDKKLSRAERFGIPTADSVTEKKVARAERFGIPTSAAVENKKASRAERFGLTKITIDSSDDKKLARAERFGIPTSVQAAKESKLATRAERFGIQNSSVTTSSADTDALKKRAERFGQSDKSKEETELEVNLTVEKDESKFSANHISFGNSDKKEDRAKRFGIAVK